MAPGGENAVIRSSDARKSFRRIGKLSELIHAVQVDRRLRTVILGLLTAGLALMFAACAAITAAAPQTSEVPTIATDLPVEEATPPPQPTFTLAISAPAVVVTLTQTETQQSPVASEVEKEPTQSPISATEGSVLALLPTPTPKAGHSLLVLPTPTPQAEKVALPTPTPMPVVQEPVPATDTASVPAPDGVPRSAHVPILMYHYLSTPPADANIYRQDLSVSPELFAAHLDRMLAEGYQTITLYDLHAHLAADTPLPEKPVILTFDDGYRDNYENAFPLLKERGMTATFFVVSDFIDEQRPEYLTWEMLREMHASGMSIESHGRNHVSLKGKDQDYLIWQALGSLETIQHELGVRPRFVSYPAGEYDQLTLDIFRSADYWAGMVTKQGATHSLDHPFEWVRVRVRGTTTADELARLLALDW
jgi:peptidoglycan/xylan/chitin deacetylase (PgdA/CDA1 family)